jgi:thioredoxin reductase (NADPH)
MQDIDVVIVGAGVAGLTAAMVAGRHGVKVAVVDRIGVGGQISTAERIENFPGFPQGIAGHELGPLLHEQAEAAGAEFMLDTIESLAPEGGRFLVRGADTLRARAVIVAAGSAPRSLGIPGEESFLGKGVSHCASCDGPFFKGQEVVVVGGGDSALDEALVLATHAARVTVVHRGASLRAQQSAVARASADPKIAPKIAILLDTVVEEIVGGDAVTGVRLRDQKSGEARLQPVKGVFVHVGLEPNTTFLQGLVTLDGTGHIETDALMRTSRPGLFAAGDIRKGSVALIAAVAGDGATAAVAAVRYLQMGV